MNRALLYFALTAALTASVFVHAGEPPQPRVPVYAEVIFGKGEAAISLEGHASLTNLAWTLIMWPGSIARIEGHAASSEELDSDNMMRISEKRASSVHEFLRLKCGVSNILETVGYSDSRPKIQRGRPEEGKNARVEVYVRALDDQSKGPM